MSDEQISEGQAVSEAPGWQVIDPDGNVVDSGPLSEAKPADWLAEKIDEARTNEGAQ